MKNSLTLVQHKSNVDKGEKFENISSKQNVVSAILHS